MTISLSISAPFSKFDLKRPTDTSPDDKLVDPTSKLLTIVKKNIKPNKEETTLLVSEELVFSSTGYPTFDAFDQNSNGFIEFEEFAATDGKDHKSNFQRADTNGDQKLSPEEFSQLSMVVYEPEQFSDSDSEEPPVVFLTPPESITRFADKDLKPESDDNFDDYKDIPVFVSTTKEETKEDKNLNEDNESKKDNNNENKENIKPETEKPKLDKTETIEDKETEDKHKEGSHFTAEDMPIKIDDEDDEEMIDVKDEDIPMEVMDDLNDDNHYDLEDNKEPQEDDKKMNDQLNSIE
jgi:hypothetical protein